MPFPMKIQPIDFQKIENPVQFEPVKPPAAKSRLKRLFERPFLLKNSAAEKTGGVEEPHFSKDAAAPEFEPSSVCLAKMVQNFIEENNEKHPPGTTRCGRNCFNRNYSDSSDDDWDSGFGDTNNLPSSGEAVEILKSLVPSSSQIERNLHAETARIIENNKICKRKDDFCRNIITEGLLALGYDASICKSRWEKQPSCPAGEYQYIDVLIEGERFLIDIDFRSEFEIARSTKAYRLVLQTLPYIFVGQSDRLQKIVTIVSEAATQSLKKKGMHIPPWRKTGYVKAKWLTPHPRSSPAPAPKFQSIFTPKLEDKTESLTEFSPRSCEGLIDDIDVEESIFVMSDCSGDDEKKKKEEVVKEWKLPEIKPRSSSIGIKMVTGLASLIED